MTPPSSPRISPRLPHKRDSASSRRPRPIHITSASFAALSLADSDADGNDVQLEYILSPMESDVSSPTLPLTPRLDMEISEAEPFSRSFSGLIEAYGDFDRSFVFGDEHEHDIEEGAIFIGERFQKGDDMDDSMDDDEEPFPSLEDAPAPWDDENPLMIPAPSSNSNSPDDELETASPTTDIAEFDVFQVLGDGGAAKVVLGRKKDSDSLFAVKCTRQDAGGARDHAEAEVAALDLISDLHLPFVPRSHCAFEDEEYFYLVMDFCPGGDLLTHLGRNGKFSPERAQFHAAEIIHALSSLRSLGIIHRDIKPENILLDAEGHIILTDFGCAKILDVSSDPRRLRSFSACGTVEYQSPEMILGWPHDFAVDVWGFGIVLYLMLLGRHPILDHSTIGDIDGMQDKVLQAMSPPFPDTFVDLSARDLIMRCLEPNPAHRSSVQEIMDHPYFSNIPWDDIASKTYPVPWHPELDHDLDLRYFDVSTGPVPAVQESEETPSLVTDHEQVGSADDCSVSSLALSEVAEATVSTANLVKVGRLRPQTIVSEQVRPRTGFALALQHLSTSDDVAKPSGSHPQSAQLPEDDRSVPARAETSGAKFHADPLRLCLGSSILSSNATAAQHIERADPASSDDPFDDPTPSPPPVIKKRGRRIFRYPHQTSLLGFSSRRRSSLRRPAAPGSALLSSPPLPKGVRKIGKGIGYTAKQKRYARRFSSMSLQSTAGGFAVFRGLARLILGMGKRTKRTFGRLYGAPSPVVQDDEMDLVVQEKHDHRFSCSDVQVDLLTRAEHRATRDTIFPEAVDGSCLPVSSVRLVSSSTSQQW